MASLMVIGALLSGCADSKFVGRPGLTVQQGDMPAPQQKDLTVPPRPYSIGPSDQLEIDVFGVPDLSKTVTVDLTGRIAMPLIGPVPVTGLTSDQVATEIVQRLRGRYVKDPRVSVNITSNASQVFTVDGAVAQPGLFPIVGRMSLLRAIARASGLTEFARANYIVVFRQIDGKKYAALYDLAAIRQGVYDDPEIYANDVIMVDESRARRIFKDLLSASPLLTTPVIALLQ
jgi:polysaccharide export outer membrane protein